MTGESDGLLSSAEVCRRVGITYRQLDRWCGDGMIAGQDPAPGYGRPRRFTPAQVGRVREILRAQEKARRALEEVGFSLPYLLTSRGGPGAYRTQRRAS